METSKQEEEAEQEAAILKLISGALRNAIYTHGPITVDYIPSAAKRVKGQLKMVFDHIDRLEKENKRLSNELEQMNGWTQKL